MFEENRRTIRFEKNTQGRDFVVGDIHGEWDMFQDKLKSIKFDLNVDRMFSVGDLIDRGPDSEKCLELLQEPWFHSVIGNHEVMMIDAVMSRDKFSWIFSGGEWAKDYDDDHLEYYLNMFIKPAMVMAITVATDKGDVGICHANPPDDWNDIDKEENHNSMIWGRTKIMKKENTQVKNVYKTYHGHTPKDGVMHLGNSVFIDTGACYDGFLTILEI